MLCFHAYTKWEDKEKSIVEEDFYDLSYRAFSHPVKYQLTQLRQCTKCNKVKIRKVSY